MEYMGKTTKLISNDEIVTAYECGDYTEIVCCKHKISPIEVTRLNRNQYVDNMTGNVREYNFSNCKSVENFKKDFKNVPRYIKGYFDGDETEKLLTLTYSFIMNNPYQLPYDFKKFMAKVERRYGKCRYFYVREPQENGSWHIHAIVKKLDNKPFNIQKDDLSSLWCQGYDVDVKSIYNVDTLAYYFDITRYEHKLSRLKYYPPYLRIYGHSQDMKIRKKRGKYKSLKPKYVGMTYEDIKYYSTVDTDTGEIIAYCENVYQQYINKI